MQNFEWAWAYGNRAHVGADYCEYGCKKFLYPIFFFFSNVKKFVCLVTVFKKCGSRVHCTLHHLSTPHGRHCQWLLNMTRRHRKLEAFRGECRRGYSHNWFAAGCKNIKYFQLLNVTEGRKNDKIFSSSRSYALIINSVRKLHFLYCVLMCPLLKTLSNKIRRWKNYR